MERTGCEEQERNRRRNRTGHGNKRERRREGTVKEIEGSSKGTGKNHESHRNGPGRNGIKLERQKNQTRKEQKRE
jgi:hypothetical protein